MLEDFTHGTLENNRGRWFINNIITCLLSPAMQLVEHTVYPFVTHAVCVYLRFRDFLPKCFSIENLRLQEA